MLCYLIQENFTLWFVIGDLRQAGHCSLSAMLSPSESLQNHQCNSRNARNSSNKPNNYHMTEQAYVSRRPCYPPSCHSSALRLLWLISRPSHAARLPSNEVLHRNFEHQASPVSALRGRPDLPATNFSLSASSIATHPYLWPGWREFVALPMWLTHMITTFSTTPLLNNCGL